jgi:hypothetical protein
LAPPRLGSSQLEQIVSSRQPHASQKAASGEFSR